MGRGRQVIYLGAVRRSLPPSDSGDDIDETLYSLPHRETSDYRQLQKKPEEMTMTRYSVYRTYLSGRDGDWATDVLADAERDFEDAKSEAGVFAVELTDNVDPENPITLASFQHVRV